ncbi:MAG: TRAP transporter small permease [Deltaproteobacteria bacterium]|nr:MAG: TRAP transporter small permease [Deltaproteobacteria bacterium]
MTEPSSEQPTAPGAAPADGPRRRWDRVDRIVYDIEQAFVVGGLLVMTCTYFLTVVFSNMKLPYNKVDQALIRLAGYPDSQSAPAELLATIKDVYTPLVAGILTFVLAVLALRTREKLGRPKDAPVPPIRWGRLALGGVLVTAGIYLGLKVVEHVPARYLGLTAVSALLGITVYYARAIRAYVRLTASAVGGVLVAVYFALKTHDTYGWNAGFSAVLLMYVAFLGASMATRDGRHIRVDAIRKALKGPGYHLYEAVSLFVTILFTAFLFWMALDYMVLLEDTSVMHADSGLPQWIVALPITVAFFLIVVRFSAQIVRAVGAWRRREPAPAPQVELH